MKSNFWVEDTGFWAAMLVFVLAVCSLPVILSDNLYGMDVLYHLNRIAGIAAGLEGGQFPVRVHGYQFNGYGSLEGIFYPDLLLYLPALLCRWGLSVYDAARFYVVFVNILTAAVSCYSFRVLAGTWRIGLIGAALYSVCWHRLTWLYLDFGLGEFTAAAFLPLVLAGVFSVLRGDSRKWPLVTLGFTGILTAHILTSVYTVILSLFACLLCRQKLRESDRLLALGKAAGFTALLNAWVWCPFLYFYVTMAVNHSQPYLYNNFMFTWWDVLRVQFLLGPLLLLAFLLYLRQRHACLKAMAPALSDWEKGLLLFAGLSLVLPFFPLLWDLLTDLPVVGHIVAAIQIPERIMKFGSPIFCLFGAMGVAAFLDSRPGSRKVMVLAFACLTIFGVYSNYYLSYHWSGHRYRVHDFVQRTDVSLPSDFASYYLYRGMQFAELRNGAGEALSVSDLESGGASVSDVQKVGVSMVFSYRAGTSTQVVLPLFYYPGYVAETAVGAKLPVTEREGDHRLQIDLPGGSGEVRVFYRGMPWMHVLDVLSLLAWFAFLLACFRSKRK
ncbi:hypothetical protein [Selenomonas sp. AB3002]|uniref:hypothetical protein n=1 Tax=Selenomonas sp. AB3002 TaxID=1392502 RepID=UPI0004952D5C